MMRNLIVAAALAAVAAVGCSAADYDGSYPGGPTSSSTTSTTVRRTTTTRARPVTTQSTADPYHVHPTTTSTTPDAWDQIDELEAQARRDEQVANGDMDGDGTPDWVLPDEDLFITALDMDGILVDVTDRDRVDLAILACGVFEEGGTWFDVVIVAPAGTPMEGRTYELGYLYTAGTTLFCPQHLDKIPTT